MSRCRVLPFRRPRPLAKCTVFYPQPRDGVSLTELDGGVYLLSKTHGGQSTEIRLTARELAFLVDGAEMIFRGAP